jgi:hypothetical protein
MNAKELVVVTRRRPVWVLLAVLVALTMAAGCSGGSGAKGKATAPNTTTFPPTPTLPPTSFDHVAQGPQPPKTGAWVGAFVKPALVSQTGRVSAVTQLETAIGRPLDVVHVYHDWAEQMPTDSDKEFGKNSVVLLSWSGADTRAIQEGQYDAVIKQQADALKTWDAKILLEWRWEMDRPNLQSQIWSPQDYIAAWKHIRAIFAAQGATNVGWVWCPLATGFTDGRAQKYYPGDDQVDWLCADVYPGNQVASFADAAAPFLNWARSHAKPIIIGELGIQKARGEATQQQWISGMATFVKTVPQIKGLVWFNGNYPDQKKPYDMSLLDSAPALSAFKGLAAQPYYKQPAPTG